MAEKRKVRCQIHCQKEKRVDAEFCMGTGIYEKDGISLEANERGADGCRCGEIRLNIKNESCTGNNNLRMEKPVRVYLQMEERPERITAMYLFNEWWTRPAFVSGFQNIPDSTQIAFFKYRNRYACFVPMVGRKFKTHMAGGTGTEICLEMTAYLGGQRK